MKKLIIMRGPPGVGKSSMCARLGLESHRLSSDDIRLVLGGAEMSPEGSFIIAQDRSEAVWGLFDQCARARMGRGETLVLDAMFLKPSDALLYAEIGRELGYSSLMLDFTDFPLDRQRAQDAGRSERARVVGPRALASTREAFANTPFPPERAQGLLHIEKWSPSDGDDGLARRAMDWLRAPQADLSAWDKIVHIGDLQGCFSVIGGPGAPLERGLDPGSFYIFCGDLLDRGIENGQVLSWFNRHAAGAPNAVLIRGNHEDHLDRWARGDAAVSREFALRTAPQLLEAGLVPADAALALEGAVDIFPYHWRGADVVATHAGLPSLPPLGDDGAPMWHLLSSRQLSRGAGGYGDPIDESFDASQKDSERPWTQVHGHRNKNTAALQYPRSVNLEGRVEFGGELRIAELSEAGWKAFEFPNKVYASWRARFARAKGAPSNGAATTPRSPMDIPDTDLGDEAPFSMDVRAPIPFWITDPEAAPPTLSQATIDAMRAHPGVLEKPMPDRPHISSLNFTREVFFDKAWDDVVVKARGLFFNTLTGEVASRGYDKFFNIGERPDTELASLAQTLRFPVAGYLKENGFLANLGYDASVDELVFASKSTTGGDFAAWFKEIFEAAVEPSARAEIKRYLRDAEACFVFEAVDPVRDPHMIEYPKPKLTLLDVFHRSEDGLKLAYPELAKAAACFGLEPKRRMFEFKNMQALSGWMSHAYKDLNYRFEHRDIEGAVFEDATGYQTKCKVPHYSFWKSMRSGKDRLARLGAKMAQIKEDSARSPKLAESKAQELANCQKNWTRTLHSDAHPMARSFLSWASEQPLADLSSNSIIALRARFDRAVGIDPAWLATRWDRFDPTEREAPVIVRKKTLTPLAAEAPEPERQAKPKLG